MSGRPRAGLHARQGLTIVTSLFALSLPVARPGRMMRRVCTGTLVYRCTMSKLCGKECEALMAGSDVFVAGTDQCDIWEVSERPEAGWCKMKSIETHVPCAWIPRFELNNDDALSNFAFKLDVRHYTEEIMKGHAGDLYAICWHTTKVGTPLTYTSLIHPLNIPLTPLSPPEQPLNNPLPPPQHPLNTPSAHHKYPLSTP